MIRRILFFAFIISLAFAPAAYAAIPGAGEAVLRQNTAFCANENQGAAEPEPALTVKNSQGVELGEIVNFLVDTNIGKVAYALLYTGNGNLQAEEDLLLVPVNALVIEDGEIILNMDEKKLANAPTPEAGQNPEEFHRRISEYYGVAPYWEE